MGQQPHHGVPHQSLNNYVSNYVHAGSARPLTWEKYTLLRKPSLSLGNKFHKSCPNTVHMGDKVLVLLRCYVPLGLVFYLPYVHTYWA